MLILSLSLACFVSPAKNLTFYEINFIKDIHFLFPENNGKIHSQDWLKGKQVYGIFLIKLFRKSEFKYSLGFILLLSLWSYRKYEIIRIKKRYLIRSKDIKTDTGKKQQFAELNHFTWGEESPDIFSTGNLETRQCFYSAENSATFKLDDINVSAERDILRILLAITKRETFCKYICIEKGKCYFPFAKLLINEPFSGKLVDSDFSSGELNSIDEFLFEDGIKNKFFSFRSTIAPENIEFLAKTITILNSNYSDYRFSAIRLAEEMNMSISQVNRKMNLLTGYPSGHLIRKFRLQKAAGLLSKNAVSVSEVCLSTGFNDLSYFSRAFKKQFDCSPSSYKREMTKKS